MDIDAEAKPKPRIYLEKVGVKEFEFPEASLDVHEDVALWSQNPRLQIHLPMEGVSSEADLELALQRTNGYDTLRKSIDDLGQMEPIYVWRPNDAGKYLVLEGATRVSILRQLDRKYTSGIKEGEYRKVRAKVLPPDFGEKERAILLARIHVRGTGVRAWGRYIEAKFVYETVVGKNGQGPLMNQAQMAQYMEKSESWVTRLKQAYEFALHFVEHVDEPDAAQLAANYFSVLEEISKAKGMGAHLRDYMNPAYDDLREQVFDMVKNDAFREYRDARFLKEFYDDPDKWSQLGSGEKHIASRLAMEVKSNSSSPKAKISSIPQMIKRSIDRGDSDFDDEDIEALQKAIDHISDQVHEGVRPFRVALKKMTQTLSEASMADVKALEAAEVADFSEALEYFQELVDRHGRAS